MEERICGKDGFYVGWSERWWHWSQGRTSVSSRSTERERRGDEKDTCWIQQMTSDCGLYNGKTTQLTYNNFTFIGCTTQQRVQLTLWRPLLPYGTTAMEHPVPDRVKPSFVTVDIRTLWRAGLSVRVSGCQKCTRVPTVGITRVNINYIISTRCNGVNNHQRPGVMHLGDNRSPRFDQNFLSLPHFPSNYVFHQSVSRYGPPISRVQSKSWLWPVVEFNFDVTFDDSERCHWLQTGSINQAASTGRRQLRHAAMQFSPNK